MKKNLIIHEKIYKKKDLASLIHKNRLQTIHNKFKKYILTSEISWADFGCSNGFIIEEIIKTKEFAFSKIIGHDHVKDLLELAKTKKIPHTEFIYFDMNKVNNVENRFDLISCFETLEHVGNFENAFTNLFNHLQDKGIVIITVPNETGFVGLIKFLGRLAVRRNPYGDFFSNQSYFRYIKYLIKNDFIDSFRNPDKTGYGPHLGFDYRKLEDFIKNNFTELTLLEKSLTGLGTTVTYVFKKQ